MAAAVKFYDLSEQIAKAKHDWANHAYYIMLTNTAPALTNAVLADITEIAAGNGYTAGGNVATLTSVSETTGLAKVILVDPTTWTASGGSIGPFRYAVMYNFTQTTPLKPLVAYWDYGSALTLAATEQFTVDLDNNGIIQFTY